MDVWLERFALGLLAAVFLALVIVNVMKLDVIQRITLGVAIVALSAFAAHTVKKSRSPVNAAKDNAPPVAALSVAAGGERTRTGVPASSSMRPVQAREQTSAAKDTSGSERNAAGAAGTGKAATQPVMGSSRITVTDEAGVPLRGVEILLVRKNGTHLPRVVTGTDGIAPIQSMPSNESLAIFCAMDGFSHYYEPANGLKQPLTISLRRNAIGGSIIFPDQTGYLPGLEGRLNPILDSINRTYLYANNIAIDGGKPQPVTFIPNRTMHLEDATGHVFEIEIVAIIGSSSLIEYRRVQG